MQNTTLLPPELLLVLGTFFKKVQPYHEIAPYNKDWVINHEEHIQKFLYRNSAPEKDTVHIKATLIGIDFKNSILYSLPEYIGMRSELANTRNKKGRPFREIFAATGISLFAYEKTLGSFSFGTKLMKSPIFTEDMLMNVQNLYHKYYLEKREPSPLLI